MSVGKVLTSWWQRYVLGHLVTPQDVYRTAQAEVPLPSGRFFVVPDDVEWDAPARLAAARWFYSDGYLRQLVRADWQHADVRLARWSSIFIELARKRDIPLYVHTCFRGEEDQRLANHLGNSKAVFPNSPHNIGEAVDVVHGLFHWDMTKQEWDLLYVLGSRALDILNSSLPAAEKLNLSWGGKWRFYDPAHWEVLDFKDRVKRLSVGSAVHMTPRHILAQFKLSSRTGVG